MLSEQQITSCDRVGYDSGCGGSSSNLDTDLYASTHGIASEAGYPSCSGRKKGCAGNTDKIKPTSSEAPQNGGGDGMPGKVIH